MKRVVMAVGAHADDIEMRCSGTVAKLHAAGYAVSYVMSTNNTAGTHLPVTAAEHATTRRREAAAAAALFGTEPVYLDLKEGRYERKGTRENLAFRAFDMSGYPDWGRDRPPIICAPDVDECVEEFAQLMVRVEPEFVFTHGPDDESDEHRSTCILTLKAFQRAARRVRLGRLYAWCRISNLTLTPRPDVTVDITANIEGKFAALRCHVSQGMVNLARPDYERDISWSDGNDATYAEAFTLLADGGLQ